eukprot:6213841-Pleurochrysis_carterae.AAC.2
MKHRIRGESWKRQSNKLMVKEKLKKRRRNERRTQYRENDIDSAGVRQRKQANPTDQASD